MKRKIVICGKKTRRKTDDGVEIMSAEPFLKELWTGNILDFGPAGAWNATPAPDHVLSLGIDASSVRSEVRIR